MLTPEELQELEEQIQKLAGLEDLPKGNGDKPKAGEQLSFTDWVKFDEEVQKARKEEGRCITCGALRRITWKGLDDCENC